MIYTVTSEIYISAERRGGPEPETPPSRGAVGGGGRSAIPRLRCFKRSGSGSDSAPPIVPDGPREPEPRLTGARPIKAVASASLFAAPASDAPAVTAAAVTGARPRSPTTGDSGPGG